MWQMTIPWWELLTRVSVIYIALLFLLRMSGKRQVGQLTPFDFVLLLIISNAVQNAMVGPDNSLTGGLLAAALLVVWDQGLSALTTRSRKLERLLEGRAEVLVHRGHVYEDVLRRQQLSHEDLKAALRHAGCFDLTEVEFAVLETNGSISVKRYEPQSAI